MTDYTHKKFNHNLFHFNNFNRKDRSDVKFTTESNFKFMKPVIINQIYLSNKNWIIYAVEETMYIKKLNKETNEYEIKFTIT